MLKHDFINQSLELNLFFLRIMKEHSIFLQAAFVVKDTKLIAQADAFKDSFTNLLSHAISLADGVIPNKILVSNEFTTKYTLEAEKATQFTTGIFIDSTITARENSLAPSNVRRDMSNLEDEVYMLNQYAISTTIMLIQFKTKLKDDVLSCRLFTTAYPLLIDHILREAVLFVELLTRLQSGMQVDIRKDIIEQECFWNRIMSEHSFFIRGLLDPSEVELFDISNNFGKEFEILRKESCNMQESTLELSNSINKTLNKTIKLRDFKAQGTEGLLNCKIRSIILPLLGDHVLREANHYINILDSFSNIEDNQS